jgi:Fur family transcriptional regulator, ferric uptake regulator
MKRPPTSAAQLGQRQTRQRENIARVLQQASGPLTVQEILDQGKRATPGLVIATIYRTLRLLLDSGQVRCVILPNGDVRYEPVGLGHHHHFLCRVCSEVFALEACPLSLPSGGRIMGGFVVRATRSRSLACARPAAPESREHDEVRLGSKRQRWFLQPSHLPDRRGFRTPGRASASAVIWWWSPAGSTAAEPPAWAGARVKRVRPFSCARSRPAAGAMRPRRRPARPVPG